MSNQKPSRLRETILETAETMHRSGIMNDATFRKINVRQLGPAASPIAEPISGEEIRNVREQAHLSQAALARYLNLTPGYVSQLERGSKQAKGPALALLNVIRRKGIDAILIERPNAPPNTRNFLKDQPECPSTLILFGRSSNFRPSVDAGKSGGTARSWNMFCVTCCSGLGFRRRNRCQTET